MKPAKLDWMDVTDLAAAICGIEDYSDPSEIDQPLFDKFDISFEQFHKIVEHLLPMIDVGTGITGKRYKGFASEGFFHVKQEV